MWAPYPRNPNNAAKTAIGRSGMRADHNGNPKPAAGRKRAATPAATGPDPQPQRPDHSGLGLDLGHIAGGKTPISALPNLGPASEADFARAGVHSAEELRAMGADAAYARLLAAGTRPHFIGYYVLHMALQGRPWNDCKGDEKAVLRAQFDALKAAHQGSDAKGRSDLEAALQFFGVVERRR